jgi:hypothetical protein
MHDAKQVIQKCLQDFKAQMEETIEEFKRDVTENREKFNLNSPKVITAELEAENNKKAFDSI